MKQGQDSDGTGSDGVDYPWDVSPFSFNRFSAVWFLYAFPSNPRYSPQTTGLLEAETITFKAENFSGSHAREVTDEDETGSDEMLGEIVHLVEGNS